MEGSSAPAIGSRRFAARANRESAAQLGIRAAERRERLKIIGRRAFSAGRVYFWVMFLL